MKIIYKLNDKKIVTKEEAEKFIGGKNILEEAINECMKKYSNQPLVFKMAFQKKNALDFLTINFEIEKTE